MLILEPIPLETVWGGSKLKNYINFNFPSKIGQLYTVSAESKLDTKIINGKFKNRTLSYVWNNHRDLFNYEKTETFPLIIGLVDASHDLSIQIHPDDEFAIEHENVKFGKEESWVFLDEPESGHIINGCKVKNKSELITLINQNKWDNILDSLKVHKHSYVHVPPCTLHALTSGSLVYEIQQSTNITYRFYDYNRIDSNGKKRELHLDNALNTLNLHNKSNCQEILYNSYFNEKNYSIVMEENDYSEILNNSDTFKCYTVIDGSLKYNDFYITQGTSFILFNNSKVEIKGHAKLIIANPR